jgi:hypothetical protein
MVGTIIVPLVIQFSNGDSKSGRVFVLVLCHLPPPFFFAHPLNGLSGHRNSYFSSDFCPVILSLKPFFSLERVTHQAGIPI